MAVEEATARTTVVNAATLRVSYEMASEPFLVLVLVTAGEFAPAKKIAYPVTEFAITVAPGTAVSCPETLRAKDVVKVGVCVTRFTSVGRPTVEGVVFAVDEGMG